MDQQHVAYREAVAQKYPVNVTNVTETPSRIRRVETGQADDASTTLVEMVDNGLRKSAAPTFIPLLFLSTEKISRQQKLVLAFGGYVLSKGGYEVTTYGKIIHGACGRLIKVQLGKLSHEVGKIVETIEQIKNKNEGQT